MYFFKIIGASHLIAKKYGRWKWTFQTNFKVTTYVTYVFHLSPLSINSTFLATKTCNCDDLGRTVKRKHLRTKMKILKKIHYYNP